MRFRGSTKDDRLRVSSGSPWEPVAGYSRALKVGERILVAGTTGFGPDGTFDPDPFVQARQAFANIAGALRAACG